jgi:hypothetical protein
MSARCTTYFTLLDGRVTIMKMRWLSKMFQWNDKDDDI